MHNQQKLAVCMEKMFRKHVGDQNKNQAWSFRRDTSIAISGQLRAKDIPLLRSDATSEVRALPVLRRFGDVGRLRALLTFGDFEFDLIALLQTLVSLRTDRAVVNKNIRPICAPDKAVSFRVIEPLYGSFQAFHEPLFLHVLFRGRTDVPAVNEMHFDAQGFVVSRKCVA
jgi:hypothetical protein